MTTTGAGIIGLGYSLPPHVRDNSWWPSDVVAGWRIQSGKRLAAITEWADTHRDALTDSQVLVVEALKNLADDPFGGSRLRHVASRETQPSELEVAAARQALDQAQVAAEDIDLVLGYSGVPDYLVVPNICAAHEGLGLRRDILSLSTDAACNSFASQLELADLYVKSGRARYVLCIQSAFPTRIMPSTADYSAWFGDAATAVVVGPVEAGDGILAAAHRTDGTQFEATLATVNGARWYDDGPIHWQVVDRNASRAMLLNIADFAAETVRTAVATAGLSLNDVGFYASHQGVSWFRAVTQASIGLDGARSFDTFPLTGSTWACNIPLVMAMGVKERQLRRGDVVATFSGGSGTTFSSVVMRWCVPDPE